MAILAYSGRYDFCAQNVKQYSEQNPAMNNKKREEIYFIGIGGIGVSGLAQWYLAEGWRVSGSDTAPSAITDWLKKKGAQVHIGAHQAGWVPKNAKLIIYSAAIKPDNPERVAAKKLGIPEKLYADALADMAKPYRLIAISGAHGKSTTTAMVSLMMMRAGLDPTVVIGTKMREFGGTNFRKGKSEWVVIEADEFHHSFLNYFPYAAIATNIDREHLDYYKTFSNIKKAFLKFFSQIDSLGCLILNQDDRELRSLKIRVKATVRWYGINPVSTDASRLADGDITLSSSQRRSNGVKTARAREIKRLLKVPGRHNLSNAVACDTLGDVLGIPEKIRSQALTAFRGTWRRFEYKGIFKGAKIYDDYAHHPTEIRATLAGARELYPKKRLVVLFQPHQTQRLTLLFTDFTRAFCDADRVIILETYRVKGREASLANPEKSARALAKRIVPYIKSSYAPTRTAAQKILRKELGKNDIAIVMGAGDVWKVTRRLLTASW